MAAPEEREKAWLEKRACFRSYMGGVNCDPDQPNQICLPLRVREGTGLET